LTVDGTPYTLYCRQGQAADYVFTTSDTYIDPNNTAAGNIQRLLAKKFSPYNLTNKDITETTTSGITTGYQGGGFVDFPTKAGAFFRWGATGINTYHPTNPPGNISTWTQTTLSNYWETIKGTQETCPSGWRRPNDGVTNAAQATSATTNYLNNNIFNSEMRQSLYALPKNGEAKMNGTIVRAWGYYADGYFDRRPIVNGIGSSFGGNGAVATGGKDAAFIGNLFFNAANDNRSLFMPAAGYRHSDYGAVIRSGAYGYYLSSSATDFGTCWNLFLNHNEIMQEIDSRGGVYTVRCVKE
jgi:hypothetical protein